MNAARPWRISQGALLVSVRATPKGGRDSVDGIETLSDGKCVLKIRVRAAPSDGEANDALRTLLAKSVRIPATSVTLVQGGAARIKMFRLSGNAAEIAAALEKAISGLK